MEFKKVNQDTQEPKEYNNLVREVINKSPERHEKSSRP